MPTHTEQDSSCKFPRGIEPVIDPWRCEARPCVPACPFDVLVIRRRTSEERSGMSPLHRFKSFVHGNKLAFVVDAEACRGCGLCLQACSERAIRLQQRNSSG